MPTMVASLASCPVSADLVSGGSRSNGSSGPPHPYRYLSGTKWSLISSAQVAASCPGSRVVGDAAMVKGSSKRRPCAHWEVLRDFFQISAMYIGLIG